MPSSDSGGKSITHHSCRSQSSFCGCLIFLEFAFFLSFSGSRVAASYGRTPGSAAQPRSSRRRLQASQALCSVGRPSPCWLGDLCTFQCSCRLRGSTPASPSTPTPGGTSGSTLPDLQIGTLGTAGFLACFPGYKGPPRSLDLGVWQWGCCHWR